MSQKIKITNGPSREELFDGLRLLSEKRTVGFVIEVNGREKKPDTWIHAIESEDWTSQSWNLKFSIPTGFISPVQITPLSKQKRSETVKAYYSTRTRKGFIIVE